LAMTAAARIAQPDVLIDVARHEGLPIVLVDISEILLPRCCPWAAFDEAAGLGQFGGRGYPRQQNLQLTLGDRRQGYEIRNNGFDAVHVLFRVGKALRPVRWGV